MRMPTLAEPARRDRRQRPRRPDEFAQAGVLPTCMENGEPDDSDNGQDEGDDEAPETGYNGESDDGGE